MKNIKSLLAILFIAIAFQLADTTPTQAKPAAAFQRIVVRTGPAHPRYYHRRVYRRTYYRPYRRPVYYRHGRPYRRPYRRY
ncbi:hypothetical protein [Mucilaginibacter agri]|uniref:Uncharacterized protein n=1 Tax=Mucilaginibacter agri TaxID=2695265 RepID=A0A965ZIP3_9SPHI|nr:hypothetical protein [Mucilaginibacter agri]NCD70797.1 hypothetical protein [Mucilaginibacter agri]